MTRLADLFPKKQVPGRIQDRNKPLCDFTDQEKQEHLAQDGPYLAVSGSKESGPSFEVASNQEISFTGWRFGARPARHTINELRKKCGWTFYELSKYTGLDRKLVIDHVKKGKGFSLRTRKKYEEAFSKELGRKISIAG